MTTVSCPECGAVTEATYDEVDVGVGIQRFLTGYDCPACGPVVGVCWGCGTAKVDGRACASWCPDLVKEE